MDRKEAASFDFNKVDFSSIHEVHLGLDACGATFKGGQVDEEVVEFLLKATQEAMDLIPDILRLLFGKNAMVRGKKNSTGLFNSILHSLSSYRFTELTKMPLELLDFLEHSPSGEDVTAPIRRILLQNLLAEQPYFFSAWVQYYKLFKKTEVEQEERRLFSQVKSELNQLDQQLDAAGRSVVVAGKVLPLEKKMLTADDQINAAQLLVFNNLSPSFLQYAAILHVRGEVKLPPVLLLSVTGTVQAEATEDVGTDFGIRIEQLLEAAIKDATIPPNILGTLVQIKESITKSLDYVTSITEEDGALITLLREKHSGAEDSQVVFDEIGSTKVQLWHKIDET